MSNFTFGHNAFKSRLLLQNMSAGGRERVNTFPDASDVLWKTWETYDNLMWNSFRFLTIFQLYPVNSTGTHDVCDELIIVARKVALSKGLQTTGAACGDESLDGRSIIATITTNFSIAQK